MAGLDLDRNALLAMLPEAVTQRVDRDATVVTVLPGDVLLDPGEPIAEVYFPLDLVVSLDQVVADNTDAAAATATVLGVALTGSEGAVGIEPFFGSETSVNRATALIGGQALRLDAELLREEFARAGAFHRLLLRWADALFGQVSAIAACERVHMVQQRLIRWLLLCDDRVQRRDLGLTQETLARLMGVRRASISTAASRLQSDGLIAYHRGSIMIRDRGGLEQRSCKCYREIKARYRAYLSPD